MRSADAGSVVVETEQELIQRAREAVSDAAWIVGECASVWTAKYSRGRSDADFGALIGLSGNQVCRRRCVHERFGSRRFRDLNNCATGHTFGLTFSHYRSALSWSDGDECLDWALENCATVSEMTAWRRMQHGEDLTTQAVSVDDPDDDDDESGAANIGLPSTRESRDAAGATDGAFIQRAAISSGKSTTSRKTSDTDRNSRQKSEKPGSKQKSSPATPAAAASESMANGYDPVAEIESALLDITDRPLTDEQRKAIADRLRTLADTLDPPPPEPPAGDFPDSAHGNAPQSSGSHRGPQNSNGAKHRRESEQVEEIRAVWNAAGLTPCRILTRKRMTALRARLREPDWVEHWREAIARASASPFCCGDNDRGWCADIDWFLRPDTVIKLIEGKYDGVDATGPRNGVRRQTSLERATQMFLDSHRSSGGDGDGDGEDTIDVDFERSADGAPTFN